MPYRPVASNGDRDTVPRPDPTRLTTEQLNSAVSALKELVAAQIEEIVRRIDSLSRLDDRVPALVSRDVDHLRGFITARLDGMDKATLLQQNYLDAMPQATDLKIEALKLLHGEMFVTLRQSHEEKFSSIQTQFHERDVRAEKSSNDSKLAIDAALQAAKEAVGEQNKSSALAIAKSEASTVKQIDQMGLLINNQGKNVDDRVSDLKERLTRIEGGSTGVKDTEGKQHANTVLIISIVFSLLSVAIAIAIAMHHW